MGNLGSYYIPDIDVDEAVKYTKTIYEFPNHSMSIQLFADKNQLKVRGGWTGMILASMKKYGLVDGRGTLRVTELAEQIINPKNENEAQNAKNKVFNKIELWSKIRSDYGDKALPSDFWAYLADKHFIDRVTAQAKAEKVAKLYTKSLAFCYPTGVEMTLNETNQEVKGTLSVGVDAVLVKGSIGELKTVDYGTLRLIDTVSIDIAITLLQNLKEKMKTSLQK
ncbi:MAG: hypothetical protein NTV61_11655 [Candidatus Bathyarchaeota archaeon]|nr:hypothetical protein [Candidatus Bathyarchaeota archaeon]